MSFLDRFFGPPTEDKFAQLMLETLRRCGDPRQSRYDKAEFRLIHVRDGEQTGITNLRNLYAEYCRADKKDRTALLARTCRGLINPMEMPTDFEDVRPDLMPSVRTKSMFELMRLDREIESDKPPELPWIPLTDQLAVCLVYDLPNSMQFVVQHHLDTWGVTLYEALEVAKQNLIEKPFPMLSLDDNLYIVETHDAYDGSRLLLTDHFGQLNVAGELIAMPVSRDCLLLTGSESRDGLGMMAAIAEQKSNEARPLVAIPLRLDGEAWQSWSPPWDLPQYNKFRELELRYYYGEYAEQQRLLERLDQQRGRDVFKATYSLMEREHRLRSFATWSRGIVTSLPKTDLLALFDPATDRTCLVPWDEVQQATGALLVPEDVYPPRWLVNGFPTEQQLARLTKTDLCSTERDKR